MNNPKRAVATLLALVLVALAGGCTKSIRRNRALAKADRYFAAEQYDLAEADYTQAAKLLFPPSLVAFRQLGLIYSLEGRPLLAKAFLEYAATNEPDNATVQLALAQTLADFGNTARAKESANRVLKLQPGNEKALILLCDLATNTTEVAQARQYIQKLQQQDQDRSSYHVALGVLDGKNKDLAEADVELKKALTLDPKSSFGYLYTGNLCLSRGDVKAAGEDFKTAAQLAPTRSGVQMHYVRFLLQTGATNDARTILLGMIQKAPDYLPSLLSLMELSYAEKKYDECNTNIAMVLARDPINFEALMRKGAVSMDRGDSKQAVADFERMALVTAKYPSAQVQYELALAYLKDGSRPKALSALNHALDADTNFIPAKLLMADLDLREGNSADAVSLLKQMEGKAPSVSVLEQVKLVLARAYLAQNLLTNAIAEFGDLEKLQPKNPEIPYLKGKAWLQARDSRQARESFNESFALDSRFTPALEELVDLDLHQARFSDAADRVNRQIKAEPKSAIPWLLLARVELAETNNTQAIASLTNAIGLDPKLPTPYLVLAHIYTTSGQEKQALTNLMALVAVTNSATAFLQIGMIYDQMKEHTMAAENYEKAQAISPDNAVVLNNLAYEYSEYLNQPAKAYALAQKLLEIDPNDRFGMGGDTLGWILYKRGDYPGALPLLRDSADKQRGDPEVHYHLGMAYYMMGEQGPAQAALRDALAKKGDFAAKEEAQHALAILALDPMNPAPTDRADLEKQLTSHPGDPIALMKLAAIEERNGEFEKAAGHYETAIRTNSQDVAAMVPLARLYSFHLNQAQKGLDLAKHAYTMAPNDASASALLGRLVFQAPDAKDRDFPYALELLQDASRNLPGQPGLLHDLAWAYFGVGNTNQAQATMKSAVDTGVPFEKLEDARRFLEMMAACSSADQPGTAEQVQKVLQADTNYAPALMASGLIHERAGQTNEAEQLYEKVLAAFPPFAPARRQLAILYTRDGNDTKASENLEKACIAYPDDAELAKDSGIVAYRRKEYQKSIQWLTQSMQNSPKDPELFYYMGLDYAPPPALNLPVKYKTNLQHALLLKLPDNLATNATRILGGIK